MSSSLTDPLLQGLTPEEELAYHKAPTRLAPFTLRGALSSALTNLAPDPSLPGPAGYIPGMGMVENLTGFAQSATDALDAGPKWLLGKIGLPNVIPDPPKFSGASAQHAQDTRDQIYQQLGGTEPTDTAEALSKDVGSGLGMMAPLAPASGLPSFAKWLVAPTKHAGVNAQVGGALGLGSGVVDEAQAQPAQPEPVQVAANVPPNTATDAPTLPRFNDYLKQDQAPAPMLSFNQFLQGEATPPGPTFDQQGYGESTVLDKLFTIGSALVALGAAKYTHGIGAAATQAARDARFTNPEYAAKAQAYNDSVIRRGGTEISDPDAPPPPMPRANVLHTGLTAVKDAVLDSSAKMQDAIKLSAQPGAAERLAHMYGMAHSDIPHSIQRDQFFTTGHDPNSGSTIANPRDLFLKVGQLEKDPARFRTWNDGMMAADELDNRRRNGGQPHNFKNQDIPTLQSKMNAMMGDTQLADIAQHYWDVNNGMVDIGWGRGYFTSAERTRLQGDHPHYVPEVGKTGEILHPFGTRDPSTFSGVDQVNSHAHMNLAQHLDALYKEYATHEKNRMILGVFERVQRDYPNAAKMIYDVPTPPSAAPGALMNGMTGKAREPIVFIRTSSGPRFVRVDAPDVFNAMTGNSLMKQHVMMDLLTIPRRMFQKGTTGVLSAVGGRIYPFVNVPYTAVTAPINAPRQMYGGLIDKLVQRTTGHTSSVARAADMVGTNLPTAGYAYARGASDRLVNRIGDWLRPGAPNYFNRSLRAYLSDPVVDSMHQSMRKYYAGTVTSEMAERGIGGQGLPVRTDLPSLQIDSTKDAQVAMSRLAPTAFFHNKWIFGSKPFLLKLNAAVQDAFTHLGDAGHEAFYRVNRDNPNVSPETLAYETRHLTGDPATSGSSRVVKAVSGALPYLNVSMQGTTRYAQSFAERPIMSAMTTAIGLGTLALISILTHTKSKEHLNYLENEVSTQQRETNFIVGTDDPHTPMMIALPQEQRMQYALMLDLMSKAVNITAMQHDPITAGKVVDMIKDFLGSHITNSSEQAMERGGIDALAMLNLPPIAGQIDYDKMLHGYSLVDSYRSPVSAGGGALPNQVPDGVLDGHEGKVWRGILTSVIGMVGTAIDYPNSVGRYAEQLNGKYGNDTWGTTQRWMDALGKGGHDWLQGFEDKNPQFNLLWENQVRLSTQTPVAEKVQRDLDALDKVTASRSAVRGEGYTSADRSALPVPQSSQQKLPQDPTMLGMYNVAEAYKSRLGPYLTEIKDIRAQMGAVQNQGMNPQARREWMNDRTRDLADKYRGVDKTIDDLNVGLSKLAGRSVNIQRFSKADMQKGVDQFK